MGTEWNGMGRCPWMIMVHSGLHSGFALLCFCFIGGIKGSGKGKGRFGWEKGVFFFSILDEEGLLFPCRGMDRWIECKKEDSIND